MRSPKLAVTGSVAVTEDGCPVTTSRSAALTPMISLTVLGSGVLPSLTRPIDALAFRLSAPAVTVAPSSPMPIGKLPPTPAVPVTFRPFSCTKVASWADS